MKRLLSITALALVIALSLAFTGCSGAQKEMCIRDSFTVKREGELLLV